MENKLCPQCFRPMQKYEGKYVCPCDYNITFEIPPPDIDKATPAKDDFLKRKEGSSVTGITINPLKLIKIFQKD